MFTLFMFGVSLLLAVLLGNMAATNFDLAKHIRNERVKIDMNMLSSGVDQYYKDTGTYPTSLATLVTTNGFEHLKSAQNAEVGYQVSGTITDTVWSFNRAVIVQFNPQASETVATVTYGNTCGSGAASLAASWCGTAKRMWQRKEARESMNNHIADQRIRQQRVISKFAAYYNNVQKLPNKDQTSAALAASERYNLNTLAGYTGTASACSGSYSWMGIPIDCSDMFDRWGNQVDVIYFSDTHIALVSVSPLKNSAGASINIASDIEIN